MIEFLASFVRPVLLQGAFSGGEAGVGALDEEFGIGGAGNRGRLGREGGVLIRVQAQAGRIGEGLLNRFRRLGLLRRQEELLIPLRLGGLVGDGATCEPYGYRGHRCYGSCARHTAVLIDAHTNISVKFNRIMTAFVNLGGLIS